MERALDLSSLSPQLTSIVTRGHLHELARVVRNLSTRVRQRTRGITESAPPSRGLVDPDRARQRGRRRAARGRSARDGRRRRRSSDDAAGGSDARPRPWWTSPGSAGRCPSDGARCCTRGRSPAEGAGVLERAEAVGEVGAVLERLELGLGVRVVVRDVGPAVALGDAQVGEQEGHRLGASSRSPGRRGW